MHPSSGSVQTDFLVSDGDDLSTTVLLSKMARALNNPVRLIPVPSCMLESGASVLGEKHFRSGSTNRYSLILQRLVSLGIDAPDQC